MGVGAGGGGHGGQVPPPTFESRGAKLCFCPPTYCQLFFNYNFICYLFMPISKFFFFCLTLLEACPPTFKVTPTPMF